MTIMLKRILCALAIVGATASCVNPRIQANMAAEIQAAADEINAQRQDMAVLQEQIDSLRFAVARQDSTIKRLLLAAGLPPTP